MIEEVTAGSDGARVAVDRAGRLAAVYRTEYAGMVRLAYTLVGSTAEAEELVQDSFVDVFRRMDEIRRPGAYVRCAVVSRCRSALTRRRMAASHPPDPPNGLSTEAGDLWEVLDTLTPDQRVAVVLRYYGGYRTPEIASIVGMPAATVRSHLRRGLATLRKELEP
jgi:RNA polymerase sigma factor (sigma-70 family)